MFIHNLVAFVKNQFRAGPARGQERATDTQKTGTRTQTQSQDTHRATQSQSQTSHVIAKHCLSLLRPRTTYGSSDDLNSEEVT